MITTMRELFHSFQRWWNRTAKSPIDAHNADVANARRRR